jgi:4-amino-4-deoxy-L-arabinose transferase-like glycosyltransferase
MRSESSARIGEATTQHSALSTQHFFLLLICAIYIVVAALFAIYTPAWQSPDEPPHYNYVAQVAANGCCPIIEMGDWNLAYQSQLTSQRFAPELLDDLDTIQYEDHQPPLYYLLASVAYNLTNGSMIGLRLFSILMGLGVILCVYAIGQVMYPERPWIGLGAAAFVAFLPQHVAILASVNNDGLAEVVIGVTLLATVLYLKQDSQMDARPRRAVYLPITPLILGILVGVGFLTKASTLFLAAVVPLAIVLKWWMEYKNSGIVGTQRTVSLRDLLMQLVLFAIPALLLGSIWWVRNVGVYGWPDFLGLRRHDLVVADQPRTTDYIADNGWQAYLSRAFGETFNSFWGQFGWMALPMPSWIYRVFQILLLVVVSGWVIDAVVLRRRTQMNPVAGRDDLAGRPYPTAMAQRSAWIILTLTVVLSVLAYVYYNTEFLQHQGRYRFPALIPFALWMALGVDAWRRLLLGNNGRGDLAGRPYTQWLTAVAFLPLALLDVYLLWRVIVPGLSP